MFLEFLPFFLGGRSVFFCWSHGAAPSEEVLDMADDVLLEHRDIALCGLQTDVPEQRRANVDREPIVHQIRGE
jgi:hypothetical protein